MWELFNIDMLLFDNKREKSRNFMTMDCNIKKVIFASFFVKFQTLLHAENFYEQGKKMSKLHWE